MKTIVIYQSSTGFTAQYAKWIASALGCEAVEIKKADQKKVSSCDRVIYGGWLMGNGISGLEKLRKMGPKQLIVFAVGVTPDSPSFRDILRDQNHLGDTPLFYLEGGIRYEKLNFIRKTMLSMVKKSLEKKPDKTEQEREMADALGASFDHSDKTKIEELLSFLKI